MSVIGGWCGIPSSSLSIPAPLLSLSMGRRSLRCFASTIRHRSIVPWPCHGWRRGRLSGNGAPFCVRTRSLSTRSKHPALPSALAGRGSFPRPVIYFSPAILRLRLVATSSGCIWFLISAYGPSKRDSEERSPVSRPWGSLARYFHVCSVVSVVN